MTQVAAPAPHLRERRRWKAALDDLADQIQSWAKARRWPVERPTVELEERRLGKYRAPSLHVHTGNGALVVEPIARYVTAGDGRVDIYGLLHFRKLLLIREKDAWKLYTEDRIPWPLPWGEKAFVNLAAALTAP